jgi:ankyrin repeat protein
MYAAAFGNAETVKILIDAGAEVNARNSFDATALLWGGADIDKVRLLVEHGADVNARSKIGRTPLHQAATCEGCSAIVRYLLSKGADPNFVDNLGIAPLTLAALAGDTESVKALLAAGADGKRIDRYGSMLTDAMENCTLPAARALIEMGADPNGGIVNAGKVKFGPIQLVGLTPLMIASPYCGADAAQMLLGAGAKVNAVDVRGMTPLMLAVASEASNPERVRILLKAGADVNAKSKIGETALDWALKYGNPEIISTLRGSGAKEGVPFHAPQRPALRRESAKEALAPALTLLDKSANEFFKQSGCVGCHHQALAAVALNAGHRAEAANGLLQMIESSWTADQEENLEGVGGGGSPDDDAYFGWAWESGGRAPSTVTDAVAVRVALQQRLAGNWHVGDVSRSPLQEGDFARTARLLRFLQLYGPPARKAEFQQRIERARDWLARSKPNTTDDDATQIMGLHWAGVNTAAQAKALAAQQRPDGGWSQNRYLASDAWATGEALWALRESGALKTSDAAYQRGVRSLLDTQWPDGSWYVRSRAPKFQPYFQSGFPFEHDQWISAAGTAWAVLALAGS